MQEINLKDINLLWHLGYYDGYLSGIAKYQGKLVYVNFIEDNPDLYQPSDDEDYLDNLPWYRKFAVLELSEEQIKFELQRHQDFESFVGNHTNYLDGKRSLGSLKPREQWDLFYKKYANIKNDYSQNKVLGFYYY